MEITFKERSEAGQAIEFIADNGPEEDQVVKMAKFYQRVARSPQGEVPALVTVIKNHQNPVALRMQALDVLVQIAGWFTK